MNNQKESTSILNTTDCFIIPLIIFLGILTRFWLNGWPDFVTFDEVHFGGFTNGYIKQEYFFDIHPPLAKLIIALVSYLGCYKGDIDFENLYSQRYFDEKSNEMLIDYVTLRLAPQLFSSFVPALIYITMRILHFTVLSSITSSSLLLFETSIICEGRFILTDGILHFFVALHLLSLFYAGQYPSLPSLIIDGITLGFACSCKSTAWSLPFLNAFVHIYFIIQKYQKIIENTSNTIFNEYLRKTDKKSKDHQNKSITYSKVKLSYFIPDIIIDIITRGALLFFLMIFIFYITFVIHIAILRYDGPGSVFLTKYIKKTLLHSKSSSQENSTFSIEPLSKRISGPSMLHRFLQLNLEMHASNMRINSFHPYQSRPLSWPLLTSTYVAFIVLDDDREINCLGNIFVYYTSFFSIVFLLIYICALFIQFLFNSIFNRNQKNSKVSEFFNSRIFFIVFGYLINYLPFFLVPRCMFLYHYQIPLIFACMAVGSLIEMIFFITSQIEDKTQELFVISKVLPKYLDENKSKNTEKVDFDDFNLMMKNFLKKSHQTNFLNVIGILCAIVLITLPIIGFLIWYPFLYGTQITHETLPLKIYRFLFKVENNIYNTSPHNLYQQIFIPDNWIWGDSYHRELSRKNEDSD